MGYDFLVDLPPTMKNPRSHIAMPDDVFLVQVATGGLIRVAVNEAELLGAFQGADLPDLAVGHDQASFGGKFEIKAHALPVIGK